MRNKLSASLGHEVSLQEDGIDIIDEMIEALLFPN